MPDGVREGYGPNAPALLRLKEQGAALVVTVDCGATAHEPLAAAEQAGLDVIVVDHHVTEPLLPPALALINPNRLDETSPHGMLAAVGVAFLLVVAVNRALRAAGWYAERHEPDLLQWLDLVALGTVCDVVPLDRAQPGICRAGDEGRARRRQCRAAGAGGGRQGRRDRSTPTTSALCSGRGSMPVAGSAPPISARGCWRPTTRRWRRELAERLDGYNRERREIEAADADRGGDRAGRGRAAIAGPGVRRGGGLASRRDRHRRGPAQGAL